MSTSILFRQSSSSIAILLKGGQHVVVKGGVSAGLHQVASLSTCTAGGVCGGLLSCKKAASFKARPGSSFTPSMSQMRTYSAAVQPLTVQDIEHRVMQLLKDFDKVDPAKVEITMAVEDEFAIELTDKDADDIMTPRQAVEKIYANKNAI